MKKVTIIIIIALAICSGWVAVYLFTINRDKTINQWSTTVSKLQSENSDLQAKYKNANDLYISSEQENRNLKDSLLCPGADKYKFDFTSNAIISLKLKDYAGDTEGSVDDATWEVIWSDAKAAIHTLDVGDYSHVYVVSFKDDGFGLNYVYYINNNCYLVTPN